MNAIHVLIMREISVEEDWRDQKAKTMDELVDLLLSYDHRVDFINFTKAEEILKALRRSIPDIVWSLSQYCRGPCGEQCNVHSLFEEEGVPYVGSPSEVLDLVREKSALKERWLETGIRTPGFLAFSRGADGLCTALDGILALADYPYIVKPLAEGNSRGLDESSIARDRQALHAAIRRTLDFYDSGLTEEYLYRYPDAGEFTVAMIGNGSERRIMPAELIHVEGARGLVTAADKRDDLVQARAVTDPALRRSMVSFAAKAFEAAGVRDYARLDLFFANGLFHAIEINGQPMVPDSWFDACAAGDGLPGRSYVEAILESGLQRQKLASACGQAAV